jgi:hypothetical protein
MEVYLDTNAGSCSFASVEIEYPNYSFEENSFAHYLCAGTTFGNVQIKAVGGVPPIEYKIYESGNPSVYESEITSGLAKFYDYGEKGKQYQVSATDACGNTIITSAFSLVDLSVASISFFTSVDHISQPYNLNGIYCEGEEVQLNCINLGELAQYEWYFNGRSPAHRVPELRDVQRPRFPATFPTKAGTYYVEVIPENCAAIKLDSLKVTILPATPVPPVVTNNPLTLCQNSGNANIVILSGVTPFDGCELKWYADNTTPTTMSPPTSVSTSSMGTLEYYVSQAPTVSSSCGGESARTKITVNIINIFEQDEKSPVIRFSDKGFSVKTCFFAFAAATITLQ